ncbi:MAG: ABC transporter permease [Flavipsychrobacter sp.]|nr:ABC transporter permease [Flavipsychrobacter sp.]
MTGLFNATLAFRAIRNNRLRSALTISIIGLGIMALVAILTAIDILKDNVYSNFSSLGANSFQITGDVIKVKKRTRGGMRMSMSQEQDITYEQARLFRQRYHINAMVGLSTTGTGTATVRFRSEKSNPNVRVLGVDEAYLPISDTKLEVGRNFTANELETVTYACIMGNGLARKLFKRNMADAVNQVVTVGDKRYRVIGIAESKGGSMLMDADNSILIPLSTARSVFGGGQAYVITVMVGDIKLKEVAAEEAEGLMRSIRKLAIGTESDFTVNQNDNIATMLLDNIKYITLAAVAIGIITLLGSVIGLMNIMLVSVAERTREIGISKALGARASSIKRQFLTESVMISLLGGLLGVVLGILAGNTLALAFKSGFVIPWLWVSLGFGLCAVVGILSGVYPAIKASRLDPIVALRYE